MWISESEAQDRLHKSTNILNRVNRDEKAPECYPVTVPDVPSESLDGPSDDTIADLVRSATQTKRAPHLTKPEAADAAIVGQLVTDRFAGQLFGKHPDHISKIRSNGVQEHQRTNGVQPPPNEVRDLIEGQRTKIRDLAFERLNTVLECLDKDKIKKVEKARELANIATQLSTVADKMLPKEMQGDGDNVHFHILRPPVATEADYEVVEVG